MSKWVAFINVKSFYVRVYRHLRRSLGQRPIVVARNGKVREACRLAQAEGVTTAIPLRQVRCLCPQAEIVTCNPDDCMPLYRQVWDIVAAHSPVVEPIDFHQGFADVSKVVTDRHQAKQWRSEVGKQIQQHTESEPSIGIGPNRFIAQLAAAHNDVVGEEDVTEFIASILLSDVGWLGSDLIEVLERLGLTTLGKVAAVSRNVLIQQVGIAGGRLHDWITGQDNQPVQPLYPPREERVVYAFDIEDREQVIIWVLGELCEQLADRLRNSGSQAQRLTLQVEDFIQLHTASQQCSRPLQETCRLYQVAKQLLEGLWEGQPLSSIQLLAEDLQPVERCQLSLWSSRRRERIDQAVEAAHRRYGVQVVTKASQLEDKRRFAQMVLAAKGRFSW